MNIIRTEIWNDHGIRFVEREPGDWWAVLADVAKALNLRTDKVAARVEKDHLLKVTLPSPGGPQEMLIVNEYGIYQAVFESRKPEAKEFKRWVFDVIKELRRKTGLEGFEVFRMLDKEHQKAAMARLKAELREPLKVDYIKANIIADKAVSSLFGHEKLLKKDAMPPAMLVKRQQVLDDTVDLMAARTRFGLDLSISNTIYNKYVN